MTHAELLAEWQGWEHTAAGAMAFLDWCEERGHRGRIGLERFLPILGTAADGQPRYAPVPSTLVMYGAEWLTRLLELNARDESTATARTLPPTFPARLAALRTGRSLTLQDLADVSGLTKQAISNYESGTRRPTWDAVQALAAALGVPTDTFRDR